MLASRCLRPWGLATLVAIIAFAPAAVGQDRSDVLKIAGDLGQLNETFTGVPKTSGRMLVGLSIGPVEGNFAPENLRLLSASRDTGANLCVRVTTRDARYWALNEYDTSAGHQANPRLAFETGYRKDLVDYDIESVAVRAVESDDCTDTADGPLRPAIFDKPAVEPTLVALINAERGRLTAELLTPGKPARAECKTPAEGALTAFNKVCRFNLPKDLSNGRYDLVLANRGLTGGEPTTQRFTIVIDGNALR